MVKFSKKTLTLLSTGVALPGDPVSNESMLAWLSSCGGGQWLGRAKAIARRLGINQRYLCRQMDKGLSLPVFDSPSLCSQAMNSAINEAGISLNDIGYMVGHTSSPHTLLPGNTAWVVERLGFESPYLELRQACTGFANALMLASGMFDAIEGVNTIAISASEVGSVYFNMDSEFLDEEQILNFMQMGDGAAAVLISADVGSGRSQISDIYLGHIGNDKSPGFYLQGGGSADVNCSDGFPVFRHNGEAVRENGPELFFMGIKSIQERGYQMTDFRFIIPHQANGHMAKMLSDATGIDESTFIVDADQLGNTGSVAIWLSFHRLLQSGKLTEGDKVLILGAEATKYLYGGFVYTH